MGRASNLGDPHMNEYWSSSSPKDQRAERWRRRREAINVIWMQNHFASAKKTTVKNSGNMDVLKDKMNQRVRDDPMDVDYKFGLPTYVSDIDSDDNSDKNSGSNIDVNTGHTSDNDADAAEEDYISLFPLCVSDINSTVVNDGIDEEEAEEDMLHNNPKSVSDTNISKDLTLSTETGNSENTNSGSMREQTSGQVVPQQGLDIERGTCDKNSGSNIDVNTGHTSDNDADAAEEDYISLFPLCVSDINSTVVNDGIDEEEAEEDMLHNKPKSVSATNLKDLRLSTETGNSENTKSGSMREQTSGQVVPQQGLDIERGTCNKTPCQDVSIDYRNNQHRADDSEYLSMLNSAHASGSPEVQCGVGFDKDYHLIINPASIVDKNGTKATTVEDESNLSELEIVVVEPNSILENTPFIPSKTYDASCFDEELNPGDGGQLCAAAAADSPFRRKLMEYLNSPFDQEEFDEFLYNASQRREKERHLETRRGVLKSYHAKGLNKSYRELYPALDNAITEFWEEPHRVLFLLRGFFFWLQHLCYEGIFEPWRDETCLEILRKM